MSRLAEKMIPEAYGGSQETYGGLPGFKEPTTSKDAAKAVAGGAGEGREAVYAAIRSAGAYGMTADEAASVVDRSPLYARPRVAELKKAGRIVKAGKSRPNKSGQKAQPWRVP